LSLKITDIIASKGAYQFPGAENWTSRGGCQCNCQMQFWGCTGYF